MSPRVFSNGSQTGSPKKQNRLATFSTQELVEKACYLETFDSDSGCSCADENDKKLEKQLSRERYLINLRGTQLITALDN